MNPLLTPRFAGTLLIIFLVWAECIALPGLPDETSVGLEARGSIAYHSNLFLRDDRFETGLPVEDSIVFAFDPTVIVAHGDPDSVLEVTGNAGIRFNRIEAFSELDEEDFHAEASASYRGSRSKWIATGAIAQNSLPAHGPRSQNAIVSSERRNLMWEGSYHISSRSRIFGGLVFNEMTYDDTTERDFNDWESFSVPFEFFYSLNEDLEIGIGSRLRRRDVEISSDRDDVAYYATFEGMLSTKVTLDLKLGQLRESFDALTIGDRNSLFTSSELTWQTTPDTRLGIELHKDTVSSGFGASVDRDNLLVRGEWTVSPKISVQATALFEREDFSESPREDELLSLALSLEYTANERAYCNLGLSYSDATSNQIGFNYSSLVYSWLGGWRF